MLTQVPLDSTLAETLDEWARAQGLSLERVMDNAVRHYLRQARREKIQTEAEHYRAMHAELRAQYPDQHVAIHDGQLVDHDSDVEALVRRLQERYGNTPVLVTQVSSQPAPEYAVRRPQLDPIP